jgi:hypothetical protein
MALHHARVPFFLDRRRLRRDRDRPRGQGHHTRSPINSPASRDPPVCLAARGDYRGRRPRGRRQSHLENIVVRVSRSERPVVRLPLPVKRPYDLVLRIDPITVSSPERVDVLFNRHLVGRLRLSWNPERVGSYRLTLREDIVNVGSNELIIIPSTMTPVGSAGPRFAWLDPADRIGVRLWYVRILP